VLLGTILAVAAIGLGVQACSDDTAAPAATSTQQDAAQQDAGGLPPEDDAAAAVDSALGPTGDVAGTINYAGEKRGTVVIAFLDFIPGMPGAPTDRPPTAGGFTLATPSAFPATFKAKVAPGKWFVSAFMSSGQPVHIDQPRAGDPIGYIVTPPQVEVKLDTPAATAVINLSDAPPGPPPGDGDAGDDAGDGGDTNTN
jgi:hypothetical protein